MFNELGIEKEHVDKEYSDKLGGKKMNEEEELAAIAAEE
jgi:hypothetical protein